MALAPPKASNPKLVALHRPPPAQRAPLVKTTRPITLHPVASPQVEPTEAALAAVDRPAPGALGALDASGGILAEITSGLAEGDDLQELLARFMPPLMELAHADAGAVRVLDDTGEHMLLVASQGLPEDVRRSERSVPAPCGICGRAAEGAEPVWSEDLDDCSRRNESPYFGEACRRVLAVPLTHRGQTLGVYNLFYAAGNAPPAGALPLLGSVGRLLGLALAHARLERENLRATVLQERQAMAADVHDSIGQSLAFVKMRLPLLEDALQAGDAREAGRYFDDVREAVGQAHSSLRGILSQFRSPPDPLGLTHALDVITAMFREACTTQLSLRNDLPAALLTPAQQHQVAQVVQEALLNVARHARAQHAWVRLAPAAGPAGVAGPPGAALPSPGTAVEVLVQDDGIGPPAAPAGGAGGAAGGASAAADAGSHYGLQIMRERARRLGGTLTVTPREGGGTSVRLLFGATPPAPAATELH